MLRAALLDMYNGEPNRGIPMLRGILGQYASLLSFDHFDVRERCEIPDLSYHIYIFSGGPGDPLEEGGDWQAPFYQLMEDLWQHNRHAGDDKKQVLFICHSFQMACQHFGIGEVSKRFKMSFGTYPVHKTHDGKEEPLFATLPDPFYIADFRRFQVTKPDQARIRELGAKILCLETLSPHHHHERALMAVRFSPEMIGTQFHPEADPDGLLTYFAEEERKKSIVEEHGEARYHHMIHDLSNPQKIRLTFETILPAFLDNAVEVLHTPDPGPERVFHS
jgi:GMP synthase-like glutamine amidotransferase